MPAFTMEDFKNKEVLEKLQVIIMSQINKNPLLGFRNLSSGEKKKFNKALNEYVRSLPEEWELTLQNEFNTICIDDIFTEKFKAEHHTFGCPIDTDIKELRKPEEVEPLAI
jgi:hypothetical protein